MTTLREKRHRQCLITIARLTDQREQAYRRLAIVQHKLSDERRRLAYYAKPTTAPMPKLTPLPEAPPWVPDKALAEAMLPPLSTLYPEPALAIPDFLKREKADKQARAEIEAEQAERKAIKTKARIAKLKATQSGDTRRMPLTGRDALKRIREG